MASTSSATPSQSTPKLNYEVFLSFRGKDVRKTFLDHLYGQFQLKGINTFKDDDKLRIGDSIAPSLLQAIEESRIAVVIFSKDYASSTWCLEEVATIMDCKDKHRQIVVPIFYDVEPSHVRKQQGSFEKSFAELEKRFNDDDGKANIERWKKALAKAADIKGHNLVADFNGYQLDCIKAVVDDIFKKLPPAPGVEENLVGLESRLEDISDLMEMSSGDVKLIGIWGMGGIGKTTLARASFDRFSSEFDGACFLAEISKQAVKDLQKKLLSELLKESSININDVYDGIRMIKTRLGSKKVLIVLDDAVDEEDKLEKLVGDGKWLCNGSRLIITTRDQHVFRKFGVAIECYEVKQLDVEKALELFSWHAFKKKSPEDEFKHLCGEFVSHASGLPLALKVWGSFLCRKDDKEVWQSTLEKIKDIPDKEVLTKLRISYDGLDENCKTVFLDIACFFRKERRSDVDDVLDGCNLHAATNIKVLIDRCLLFESYGRIDMHDLIHEMGLNIAREKPRSRRWQLEDLDHKLKVVERLLLSFTTRSLLDENIRVSIEALKQMKNLKMLIVRYRYFSESEKSCWMSIMDYHPRKLVLLKFRHYPLSKLFCTKELNQLTYLDLSSSHSLLATPNFELMPNLKKLNLSSCEKLKEIHPSVGRLEKLVLLDLSYCVDIKELPVFIQVSSLKFLKLEYCKSLEKFPEIQTNMPYVVELNLFYIAIRELPSSIQRLCGLTKLSLYNCKNLDRLSNDLCELESLKILELIVCGRLESLPENLGNLSKLEYLSFQRCDFVDLPESFSQLPRLLYLDIRDCEKLEVLPKLPKTIRELCVDSRFAYGGNIAELATEYSQLYSVEFFDGSVQLECFIHFPFRRETSFSVIFPILYLDIYVLTSFQYRCYESNGISIDLNPPWYSQSFMGFAVCFEISLEDDMWGPHSYQGIDSIKHCAVIAELSINGNEVLQTKCVIAGSPEEDCTHICFAYIPFSSLGPESKTKMEADNYSRFEVKFPTNVKGSAHWGCSLLYKREEELASWDGSLPGRTTDIGALTKLEYLNLSGKKDIKLLPKEISQSESLKYLDISGCKELRELPELPANIRELYAHSRLASESNIAELATKYSQLYSVSFLYGYAIPSAKELARKFVHVPFQIMRNSPFVVSYPLDYWDKAINIRRWFKYQSCDSNKISIELNPSWYRQAFVGFVVCFLLYAEDGIWESSPHVRPFRHGKVTAKLVHKDDANEVLETNCVIGRLYDEQFDDYFWSDGFICFAYIPICSLLSKYGVIPNDYLVFEVAFLDSNASTHWSCGLLYQNDESLSEAIISGEARMEEHGYEEAPVTEHGIEETPVAENIVNNAALFEEIPALTQPDPIIEEDCETTTSQQQLGVDRTKPWELTEIVHQGQCRMVSMPECSDAKVVRLLYENSGVGILALSSNGIQKLWNWPHNEQNPSRKGVKATANSVPQHWQTNCGLVLRSGVSAVNLEEVVPCIDLSKDGCYVVAAVGRTVLLYNMITFKEMELPSASTFLAFHPHDYNIIAIGMEESSIYIYDYTVDEVRASLRGHQKRITGLAFSTDLDMLVSSGADAQLYMWSIDTWEKIISVPNPIQLPAGEGDTQVMFHVDQVHLLVTHETQLAIYDASKMELVHQWTPHGSLSAPISSATYSCNSKLVYASFKDGNIGVLDADTLTLRCRIAPSAYLSQVISNRSSEVVYPAVIAAHPEEPNQFAVGLTNGSVKVIEPLESEGCWEPQVLRLSTK